MITEETKCRICNGGLGVVTNYGEIYPSGFVKNQENLIKAPLVLAKCVNCGLVQLKHTIDLDLMYRQYWYSSALNKSMIGSLYDVAIKSLKFRPLNAGDVWVDIGCNDGTLFKVGVKPDDGVTTVGYDPSINLGGEAEKNCNIFINDYFSSEAYPVLPKASLITAIAMFYDLPDPRKFLENIKDILADDGIFVIQLTDLYSMLKINAFDNVCHEHLEYYSLDVLQNLMLDHGLTVFHVEYNDVNGGSLRAYICWKGKREIDKTVWDALIDEYRYFASFSDPFFAFNFRVKAAEEYLKNHLQKCLVESKKNFLLGASTKGNTLLQVWNLTNKDFQYALEVNQDKFGLRTVGSDIPIISESDGLQYSPDFLVMLPWHFIESVKPKMGEYLNNGGSIITPLPNFSYHFRRGEVAWTLESKVSVSLLTS